MTISGRLWKQSVVCGDGVIGRIIINGVEQWFGALASYDGTGYDFNLEICAIQGDIFDFAIDPVTSDHCDSTGFTILIRGPISQQPAPVSICPGGDAVFTVDLQSDAFGVQWQYDDPTVPGDGPWLDLPQTNHYDGSQTTTLTIADVTFADETLYRCQVFNACGIVTSEPVALSVCESDFDCSGAVTSADITAFLSAWFSDLSLGTLTADVNNSGATTSADITAFLAAWFAALGGSC